MRDFDVKRKEREERDRSFVIGGERFVFRPAVAPETILGWSQFASIGDKEKAALAAARSALNAATAKNAAKVAAGQPLEFDEAHVAELEARLADAVVKVEEVAHGDDEWLNMIDSTVVSILEPAYKETWETVRDPDLANPLNLDDLNELVEWLVGEVVGRPTTQPSGSSSSGGETETSSTVESSSPEERASAPLTLASSAT